jgi:hypothetical protein
MATQASQERVPAGNSNVRVVVFMYVYGLFARHRAAHSAFAIVLRPPRPGSRATSILSIIAKALYRILGHEARMNENSSIRRATLAPAATTFCAEPSGLTVCLPAPLPGCWRSVEHDA